MARLFTERRLAVIPWTVMSPWMCGLISDDEICVTGLQTNDTYVININTRFTRRIIEGDSNVYFTSCVPIYGNEIVCGMGLRNLAGGRLDRCIALYDRQLTRLRYISIPRNNRSGAHGVYVDVDSDGMILATENRNSNTIYVINPANDRIVNTITIQGKKTFGEIQALSSGDIVVRTGENEFTVISRLGAKRRVIKRNNALGFSVNKLTDTLFITYFDRRSTTYKVEQKSCDGSTRASRVVSYVESRTARDPNGTLFAPCVSRCIVTPSGYLAVCDGNELFVYRN